MIGQIISSLGGLASSYLEGKTAIQKANAQIKMKEATGEIDWDLAAMRASQSSWKDEYLVIIFSFCGEWGRSITTAGFQALAEMPEWYQYSLGIIISATFATRSAAKFINMRKKK
jgi:hypothetical protein